MSPGKQCLPGTAGMGDVTSRDCGSMHRARTGQSQMGSRPEMGTGT